jgi:2-polyprenyl-3-methyl-5-hydroxy-6-metoxy-1,4-benzoquinol methylase
VAGPRSARYDRFADWYVPWVGDSPGLTCDPASAMVAADLRGERWLDMACGAGRTARELARRGASVLAVDLSTELVAIARHGDTAGIEYVVADVTQPGAWWDGERFDGVCCEMALMDIDDLDGTLAAVAEVLRPGGSFVLSIVNPCFAGSGQGLSSWPPDGGYTAEGFWTSDEHDPAGVRIRVGSNHRMLSTYLNALIDAGFDVARAFEPSDAVPTMLVLGCVRR